MPFIQITRTNSAHPDFILLVKALDADLAQRDGADNAFYSQFNKIDLIKHAVVAYIENKAVGCGAIKAFDETSMEIKRMYTIPEHRGKGVAAAVLGALEGWAAELGFDKTVLETGKRQPEAIALYQKQGYRITPNYGQYIGIENSVCFEKALTKKAIPQNDFNTKYPTPNY